MKTEHSLRIIERREILSLMDWPGLIRSAEEAFIAQSKGLASAPQYINMPIGNEGNFAHFKTGYKLGGDYFTVKYSGGFWYGLEEGEESENGYVIVHRASDGKPLVMFLDNDEITNHRTAAAGAVAAKYVSREDSQIVGVIGTGIQARNQIEALTYVRPAITTVKVWGRRTGAVEEYIVEMKKRLPGINFVTCKTPKDAVDVDILVTTTASQHPIVKAEWLKPGLHITAVGACSPVMQELEAGVLGKATYIYTDSTERCLKDGEVHHGVEEGVITEKSITGELGDLITGKVGGRESNSDITIVDLVGLGIQDLYVAQYLLDRLEIES